MKYYFIIFTFIFGHLILSAQTEKPINSSSVEFKSSTFKNGNYFLVGYYGKYTVLLDSVKSTNEGSVLFKKSKKYTEGIYMLVDADKKIVLEFLMDTNQQFSINVNTLDVSKSIVNNSKINQDFFNFNSFLNGNYKKFEELNSALLKAQTKKDSLSIKNNIISIQKAINNYKFTYGKEHPENLISLLFKLSQPLDVYFNFIENSNNLKTKNDSLLYVKNKYFEGLNFSDQRLLRTPFLENKMELYFNSFITPTADEITSEIFKILDKTGSKNDQMFSYLSLYFINKYSAPKIMGLDKVFINIYQKHYKNKEYSWLTTKQKLALRDTYIDLKDNQIGALSPNLFMVTLQEKRIDLYDVKAPFIVLIFWDPTCGHCKAELPEIKKEYDTFWKARGIKIFAVNINVDLNEEWKNFIKKKKLDNWIHVYPSNVVTGNYTKEDVDFQTLFNVSQTPVMYLLDGNKNIIAKKVGFKKYLDIIKSHQTKLN